MDGEKERENNKNRSRLCVIMEISKPTILVYYTIHVFCLLLF